MLTDIKTPFPTVGLVRAAIDYYLGGHICWSGSQCILFASVGMFFFSTNFAGDVGFVHVYTTSLLQ